MRVKMSKLVSVIIPTYNRPETVKRAVDSVLNQTYDNIEVIVCDDNGIGTEAGIKTANVMSEYSENAKVKYVQHEVNINGSAARNTGFRASRGDYVMFLDDDDEFLPEKVSTQLARMESLDESWGACYADYIKISEDGKSIIAKSKEKCEGELLIEELKRNLFISAGSNLMIRRFVVEEIGGFDETFVRNQDQEFLVKILKKYKLAYAPVLGLIVHAHKRALKKFSFEEVTASFLNKFKNDIESLGDRKYEVYKMIDLQRFRIFLRKKDFKNAFSLIKTKRVSIFEVFSYFMHLAHRKIFKLNYGYKHKL